MLVLKRRLNEVIVINRNIYVKVIEFSGGQFKIAVDAPRDVPVYRQELWDAIQEELRSGGQGETECNTSEGIPATA